MLKNIVKLECAIGEKQYQLLCDNDSPLTNVKEALFQFLKYIGQIEDQVKASQPAGESISAPEVKEEVSKTPED